MTESDWLTCADPATMLALLRTQRSSSERKLRLFATACCRQVWDWLGEKSRVAVDVLERHVDGQATVEEMFLAARGASDDWMQEFGHHHPSNAAYCAVDVSITPPDAACAAASQIAQAVRCEALADWHSVSKSATG